MPEAAGSAGRPMETRWPCPVCLGVSMQKAVVGKRGNTVTLDLCPRCGGIWFERGEVQRVSRQSPEALWSEIPRKTEPVRPPCHGCGAPLDRDLERCPACGHRNVLRCPMCDVEMERRAQGSLVLDLCRRCEGVWFDHAELSELWRLGMVAASRAKQRGRGTQAAEVGGEVLLNTLFWAPDLLVYGASAATHAAGAAAQGIGSLASSGAAADAATAAAEAVGSAAESVFSMIADIIGGLFDG